MLQIMKGHSVPLDVCCCEAPLTTRPLLKYLFALYLINWERNHPTETIILCAWPVDALYLYGFEETIKICSSIYSMTVFTGPSWEQDLQYKDSYIRSEKHVRRELTGLKTEGANRLQDCTGGQRWRMVQVWHPGDRAMRWWLSISIKVELNGAVLKFSILSRLQYWDLMGNSIQVI